MLSQLRPLLAIDARSLLATDEFGQFVRSLLQDISAAELKIPFPIEIALNLAEWSLNQQPALLQMRDIEILQEGGAMGVGGIRVQAEMGTWQRDIFIPTSISQSWLIVAQQLQDLENVMIAANLQNALMQEMMCLFAYIGALFWLDPIANQFFALNKPPSA
ncbi:hypothetical protein LEP3755_66630 (plasmid) [Leptolyngbya sp. NIES-3755]|nr:hypothetical protein LEP3755_66630 [Leptolyngbya sp. NIES-3755]